MNSSGVPFSAEALIKEAKAFNLKKRLGQHFLVDPAVLNLIADSSEATIGDTVIEIGPGIGFLTRFLCQRGCRVVAVDLDRESIARLTEQKLPGLEIKHGDFLQFNLSTLAFNDTAGGENHAGKPLKIIGNVPYQITGLIIGHLLGELDQPSPWLHDIDNVVLTVQYEVARRMVAQPGSSDYSKLSLLVAMHAQAEIVAIIPSDAFVPPPAVRSAVVKLAPHRQRPIKISNERLMKQLIEAGFRQRRKMLRNSLGFLQLPQSTIDSLFSSLRLDPQVRAERLSLAQFAMLAEAFDQHVKANAKRAHHIPSKNQPGL